MKIIVFGIGNTGKKFYDKVFDNSIDEVIAFSDNNDKLWNSFYKEIPIISPKRISQYSYDCIVVASIYDNEIILQLKEMGITNLILTSNEYQRYAYTRKRYAEKYSCRELKKEKIFSKEIVVYTCITGEYDCLNDPLFFAPGIRYICFTNNKELKSDVWEMRYIFDENLDNMYLARYVKFFPNKYLEGFETSVWVDGKFQIIGDLREYVSVYQNDKPILCFPHFARKCIYEEAARCLVDGIGQKRKIIDQITKYNGEAYPLDNGLYETGCIVRKHNDKSVIALMNDWWDELTSFSYRDQICFPYVCWKNHFSPDISDQDIYKNEWLLCKRSYNKDMIKH